MAWVRLHLGHEVTEDFTRLWPTLLFAFCIFMSFFMLTRAAREIPLGTAYAVWGGIGTAGTVIVGILVYKEPVTALRMLCLVTLLASITGSRNAHMNDTKAQLIDKTVTGNYFEDFTLGQEIVHATPRTVTVGDVSLFTALYGSRFAVQSSDAFAQKIGYPRSPVDDLLVFHIVIGKTVPDISRNAIANLGYAEFRFIAPVYPGDTLASTSKVIGVKENSNKKSGTVYVRSTGKNQRGQPVLSYARWVMVNKRNVNASAPTPVVPDLAPSIKPEMLGAALPALDLGDYDYALAGSPKRWGDYAVGEKIDHVDGQTIEEAEHQLATRLFQNTARVHFNQHVEGKGRFGRRLVYGGHIISIARSLSYNGLANAFHILGLNGARHVAPSFAGDTIYAWTEVIDKAELPGHSDMGALRLRTFAVKDRACADFPGLKADGSHEDGVVLDTDYWAALPR
jgi:2-methylfumaryl-CoA hydratase